MLLLDTTSQRLCEFLSHAPAYATFSTRWENGRVLQDDPCSPQTACQNPGSQALQKACLECQRHGLQWLWNDAICINRTSKEALSESLNSLAEIYRKGSMCIVYLHDLLETDTSVERGLSGSTWFEHVWMLPHLIFSSALHFYNAEWRHIGCKSELIPVLSRVTSIGRGVLEDWHSLGDCSNSTKMSWAAGLSADRIEDTAYSLLAIFNTNMPVKYGEGMNSFLRLQEKILENTRDYSLLAWQPRTAQQYRGLLAHSPEEYSHLKHNPGAALQIQGNLIFDSDRVHIQAGLGGRGNDLLLPLHTPGGPTTWVVLSLWDGLFVRNCTANVAGGAKVVKVFNRNICVRRHVDSDLSDAIASHRPGPKDKLTSTSGQSRQSSICVRMNRHGILGSDQAPPVDAVVSEAACDATQEIQGGEFFSGLPGGSLECPGEHTEDFPGLDSISRPHNGETADEEASRASLESAGGSSQHDPQEALDEGHPFAAVLGELKTTLVDRFLSTCDSRPAKRALLSWARGPRKRARRGAAWSDAYAEVELAPDPEDLDAVVVSHAGARASTFACPFYLMDRGRHAACLTRARGLPTAEDVREHLWAAHRRPSSCPICGEAFPTLGARDDHIRRRSCRQPDDDDDDHHHHHHHLDRRLDGLTDGQVQQLARQGSEPPLSREGRWFEIWDVVWPSCGRPPSPYYSTEQEFRVLALKGFCEANGPTIISDFLRDRGLLEWEVANEERNLAILHRMVLQHAADEVYRRFSGGAEDVGREH